ncbi:MAG: glutathione S-transferase [Luteimonas sp.]
MITVHRLENSRSQRILWLMEELGLDYDIVRYARDPITMLAPPELRAIHPLGKSPIVVEDGDVLAESAVIIETLVERHDAAHVLSPVPGTAEATRHRYWMHYAEGSAMPPLLLNLVFSRLKSAPMPFFARPIARSIADKALGSFVGPQMKLHVDYMEAELARHTWFAGDRFTAADIQMSFPIEAAAARAGFANQTRLQAYLERIHERPAYRRALERGGSYDLMR